MKAKTFYVMLCLFMTSLISAQSQSPSTPTREHDHIYTSLRPPNGHPAVFPTQSDLDQKIESKKGNIIALIAEFKSDTAKVRLLRYDLWRFENAIVVSPDVKNPE
jgi:hypothetical protein